jgi:hypothetical protein
MVVLRVQSVLYGSASSTGYGSIEDLYAAANALPNLRLYSTWLWETHGPIVFVGLAAPLVAVALPRLPRSVKAIVWCSVLFAAANLAAYLFYGEFENWTYTRFLLPSLPLLLMLAVWTVRVCARRLGPLVELAAAVAFFLVALSFIRDVGDRAVLQTKVTERRYRDAAAFVAAATPETSVVVSMQHSGSIRYYAGREIVRYDWLDPDWLDRAISTLRGMGRRPLLVLDDWEEPAFQARFKDQQWGRLDWRARYETRTRPTVRVYDPFDREGPSPPPPMAPGPPR